jgi:hypothetical protein
VVGTKLQGSFASLRACDFFVRLMGGERYKEA